MKAATQIRAQTDFTRTYDGYNYKFYVTTLGDLPDPYYFSSDVIDYVIETCGKAQRYQIENRSNIVVQAWAQETISNIRNFIYSTVVNAYIATGNLLHDYVNSDSCSYFWDFSCTGIDPEYPGWDTYGTAYGFEFKGMCGDTITLTLDSQGDFYGHNPIGNYQVDPDPEPYNWILINQGLDNFYVPSISDVSFNDLEKPYIKGNKLYFTVYEDSYESLVYIDNFEYCALGLSFNLGQNNPILSYPGLILLDSKVTSNTNRNVYFSDGTVYKSMGYTNRNVNFSHDNTVYSSRPFDVRFTKYSAADKVSLNLPSLNLGYIGSLTSLTYDSTQVLGCYNSSFVNGSVPVIWLESFSYNVNPDPNPIPENPIPITSIPEDPNDPIPQTNPDPIPGITFPDPVPLPLPPFATIVSGNDDLWRSTLDFDDAQNSLLPYLNSLATFEFPSFNDLISDFSGSIIWVAQIMSVLYNGSSFNVLFIALCLFSLVSIIIGGYKLWSTTEPDPNNPGFRRIKKPPKGPKGRRRR